MIRPSLKTPPAALPVTLEELKAHARVDFDEDDGVLQAYLSAAVAHLDGYAGLLGRCLVTQTWTQPYQDWCYRLALPFPDVSEVSVTYLDAEGAARTVAAELYEVIEGGRGGEVVFRDAFEEPGLDDDAGAPITITFAAGYGSAAAVPSDIRIAIIALARHWYDGLEGTPPQMVLLAKHRLVAT